MTKKWTPARVGAVVLAVLVVCWMALMWFGGSVPFRDRQSLDEYVDEEMPKVSQIAGQVAAETGGRADGDGPALRAGVRDQRFAGLSGFWVQHSRSADLF